MREGWIIWIQWALFAAFLTLKLFGLLGWSWWWVTSPIWAGYTLMGICFTIAYIQDMIDEMKEDEYTGY